LPDLIGPGAEFKEQQEIQNGLIFPASFDKVSQTFKLEKFKVSVSGKGNNVPQSLF
jgi:hypothetical protein